MLKEVIVATINSCLLTAQQSILYRLEGTKNIIEQNFHEKGDGHQLHLLYMENSVVLPLFDE